MSNERGFTQSMVQRILQFIDDLALAKLIDDEQDYVDYGDGVLEGASEGRYDHWEPAEPSPGKGKRSSSIQPPHKLAAEAYPWDSPDAAPEQQAEQQAEQQKEEPAGRKRDDTAD